MRRTTRTPKIVTNWRITFPIEKAEQRDDGFYVIGLASGPEIDATDERMDQELVYRYADQINASGGLTLDAHLPYRDAHAQDGVMRDLGWLTNAWINDQQRLAVEVKLDEDNPAAMYLFRQLKRGKKYGMSVAGKVLDYVDEWVAEVGKTIRTYKDVILTEISNTTRPAWTPSFGSVLAKAISDAGSGVASGSDTPAIAEVAPQGELMPAEIQDAQKAEETAITSTEETVVEQPTDEATSPSEAPTEETAKADDDTTDKSIYDAASASYTLADVLYLLAYTDAENKDSLTDAANSLIAFIGSEAGSAAKSLADAARAALAEALDEGKAPESTEKAADEAAAETPAPTAEEAPAAEPVADVERSEPEPDLVSVLAKALGDALRQAGLVKSEAPEAAPQADSQDDAENPAEPVAETPSEETTQKTEASREELERSVAELTAKVAELEGSAPTILPPVVERNEASRESFNDTVKELPRDRRLAAAFAAKTGGR